MEVNGGHMKNMNVTKLTKFMVLLLGCSFVVNVQAMRSAAVGAGAGTSSSSSSSSSVAQWANRSSFSNSAGAGVGSGGAAAVVLPDDYVISQNEIALCGWIKT